MRRISQRFRFRDSLLYETIHQNSKYIFKGTVDIESCRVVLFCRWTKFASVGASEVIAVDINTTVCSQLTGFVTEQRRICESKPLIVPSIRNGVRLAMEECKKQLSKERWDCTTMTEASALRGLLAIRKCLSGLYSPVGNHCS